MQDHIHPKDLIDVDFESLVPFIFGEEPWFLQNRNTIPEFVLKIIAKEINSVKIVDTLIEKGYKVAIESEKDNNKVRITKNEDTRHFEDKELIYALWKSILSLFVREGEGV